MKKGNYVMEKLITNILLSLGIHKTNLGFHYLKKALLLCFQNEDFMLCYIRLFGEVAAYYNTTADNVDHCIRSVVKKCYYYGNPKLLGDIAGYTLDKRPTNSAFIEILFHYLEKLSKTPTL